ncbi:MAG: DUF2860 family protein [Desulfobacteraceae bacterium]
MKQAVLIVLFCFGVVLLLDSAQADEAGFGGMIIVGGVWENTQRSQLDASDGNDRIDALAQNEDRETDTVPHITGELTYTLANRQTSLFLTTLVYDSGMALGVRQDLGDWGQIEIAGTFESQEVWKDPYRMGVKRSRTDETTVGLSVEYEQIAGTGFLFSSHIAGVEVDKDRIGSREERLRRDGHRYTLATGYQFTLGDNVTVVPTLTYTGSELQGDANASDGVALGIAYEWSNGSWSVEAAAAVGRTRYRERHPVFNETRTATALDLSLITGYYEPFGLAQISVYSLLAYGRVTENIDFFDSDAVCVGLGFGYHF